MESNKTGDGSKQFHCLAAVRASDVVETQVLSCELLAEICAIPWCSNSRSPKPVQRRRGRHPSFVCIDRSSLRSLLGNKNDDIPLIVAAQEILSQTVQQWDPTSSSNSSWRAWASANTRPNSRARTHTTKKVAVRIGPDGFGMQTDRGVGVANVKGCSCQWVSSFSKFPIKVLCFSSLSLYTIPNIQSTRRQCNSLTCTSSIDWLFWQFTQEMPV